MYLNLLISLKATYISKKQTMELKSAFDHPGELRVSGQAKRFLSEAAGWARFLSVLGLVLVALQALVVLSALLFGAFSGLSMGPFEGAVIMLIYGLLALFYFLPLYYLFLFSGRAKRAIATDDTIALEDCFGYLRSHYRFVGIIIIIMLAVYILAMAAVAVGSFASIF